jgi:hypothetical protein
MEFMPVSAQESQEDLLTSELLASGSLVPDSLSPAQVAGGAAHTGLLVAGARVASGAAHVGARPAKDRGFACAGLLAVGLEDDGAEVVAVELSDVLAVGLRDGLLAVELGDELLLVSSLPSHS